MAAENKLTDSDVIEVTRLALCGLIQHSAA
jgi:hypothetical protein